MVINFNCVPDKMDSRKHVYIIYYSRKFWRGEKKTTANVALIFTKFRIVVAPRE